MDIREGIAVRIPVDCKPCTSECATSGEHYCPQQYLLAGKILQYLHSQGVVKKVERELPTLNFENSVTGVADFTLQLKTQKDMLDAGYVTVEELE